MHLDCWDLFHYYGVSFSKIINYVHYNDEIIYPFPNFNGFADKV